ncbi:aldehyde dehydrogenase family protein [Streptomyces silvae]|uniref:Aldehyde dehydrogenase family protein n=1 Tax=Streptomyces silvae TaxID=2803812 RepID=A0ABU7ZUL7_9ACTN
MTVRDDLYIGGSWVAPSAPELTLDILSPHDQSVIGRVAQAAPADVDKAVVAARAAFDHGPWPHTTPAERQEVVRRYDALRTARADEIAEAISAENGSAGWFTKVGQPFLTRQVNAYLKAAEEFGWEEVLAPSHPSVAFDTIVRREAIGVVAAVIPWNSPFSAATAKLVPALLAGNTVVLKVSPENSLSMALLADLWHEAGLPEGVLSVLPADRQNQRVPRLARRGGQDLLHRFDAGGRRIASIAGEQLKRVGLGARRQVRRAHPGRRGPCGRDAGSAVRLPGNNGEACILQTRILAPAAVTRRSWPR